MQFGICTSIDNADIVKAAGWDFVEESVGGYLQPGDPDDQWRGPQRRARAALPVPACNMLVPGNLKITGPDADLEKLRDHMTRVLARASAVGVETFVFGSGRARSVPDGFDRDRAKHQIIEFLRMSCPLAQKHGVTLVAEPLNRGEDNMINSVGQAMEYVRAVNHPNFQCLLDTYHFWLENDSLDVLAESLPHIRHVHLADRDGRLPPGESKTVDYRPIFRILKSAGYKGRISVEAKGFEDISVIGPRVLAFVREQWGEE